MPQLGARGSLVILPGAAKSSANPTQNFESSPWPLYDAAWMSAIHVLVRPGTAVAQNREAGPLYGLFDVVVDGVNLTARIGDRQAIALVGELAHAVAELMSGQRPRVTLQLYTEQEAWELGLEADGREALLSVFRAGVAPEVAAYGRRVLLADLRDGVLASLGEVMDEHCPGPLESALNAARSALMAQTVSRARTLTKRAHEVSTQAVSDVSLSARADFRHTSQAPVQSDIERSDLHSLLMLGAFRAKVRGRTVSVNGVHPFLVAERLVELAQEAVDAWQTARPLFRRVEVGELRLGIRRGPGEARLALTLGRRGSQSGASSVTFPELGTSEFSDAVAEFAQRLSEAFTLHDPGQRQNLRLSALRTSAAGLVESVSRMNADHTVLSSDSTRHRSFSAPPRVVGSRGRWEHGGKIRFLPRWTAVVPNVELRSVALQGDHFFASSARETMCLHGSTGELLWRVGSVRAGSIATAHALVRLHADGKICLHDLDTGLVRATVRLTPRSAGGATGAVVQSAGLPKLLVVAEAERRITAVDLVSGEIRWRYTAPTPGAYRVRRAGRLIMVSGGATALTALDVVSGEVAWRSCDRLPFSGDMSVDRDLVFTVSGARSGQDKLLCYDLQNGKLAWSVDLDERPVLGQAVLVSKTSVIVPTQNAEGLGAMGFSRDDGKLLWRRDQCLAAGASSWLVTEDTVMANSASGALSALDTASGESLYTHTFSHNLDGDGPRRLELQVRDGALFVPQHQAIVLRPRDGELLGTVPCDLVPDVLRVDESCAVYVTEDSGHIAAFSVAPQLMRIK